MTEQELIYRMKMLGVTGVNQSAVKDVFSVEQFADAVFSIPTYNWFEKMLAKVGILADEETNDRLARTDEILSKEGV